MQNKGSQVRGGAVLAYILIILNATYGLFLTPFIIGQIGDAAYGVYKTISSFTASFMVLDLGLGGTMMRYIAKYRSDDQHEKTSNFIAMGFIQASVIGGVIAVVSTIMYFFVDDIYSGGLTIAEIAVAKKIYVVLALCLVIHVFENLLNGIISGYNKFVFANGIKVLRLIARVMLVVVFLGMFENPLTLAVIDLAITSGFVFVEIAFIIFKLKVTVKLVKWDRAVFSESFVYTLLMFLSLLVAQANTNFSNIIIGSVVSSAAVTIYSMALMIFGIYEQLSTAISGVVLPTVVECLKKDDEKYTNTVNFVVKMGRVQFLMLGAALAGFLVLGKQFVGLWLGEGYSDVYYLTLIMIGPALLELCINVCLSILRAKNMLGFRTLVISVMAGVNLLLSLLLVKRFGYYVCAISSSLCYCIGSVLVMGIYYYRKFRINLFVLYKRIFGKIWICIVLSALAALAMSVLFDGYVLQFAGGVAAFVLIYGVTLLAFGLNKEEKKVIFSKVRRNKND